MSNKLPSWLPEGGTNLFQEIKAVREDAAARGIKILNLSIGQPQGPALLTARIVAASAVRSDSESMHEYQDNGNPGVPYFAKRFVCAHVPSLTQHLDVVDFLPVPGIKPMLGLIPLACDIPDFKEAVVLTTTNPGYGTPADWCRYLKVAVQEPELSPENRFRFDPMVTGEHVKLMMINYPHNPSGQVADSLWLQELCEYCEPRGIRIFNDAAYFGLSHTPNSTCLSQIAPAYENLSWAEAFSASKIIGNGTGWRVGAIVGSPDFVADIAKIKGNTDSGFFAPAAAGALDAVERDVEGIAAVKSLYKERLLALKDVLEPAGMQLAVEPGAGFFTLWKVPKRAFGEEIADAKDFNFKMIERTGVTGVHFNPKYIRYAVCNDVVGMASELAQAFEFACVDY